MKGIVTEAAFNAAYAALNAAQKQAVDTIEGPVMVIAGPGTGKTQILTLRIANILRQSDSGPENILALTFTEAGVRAMRTRLRSLIGEAAYRVRIQTFHGFSDSLIAAYPDAYPTIIGGQAASELERLELLTAILTDPQYKALRPHGAPEYYLRPIMQAIQTLKQEYVSPDDLAAHVAAQAAALDLMDRYHEKGAHKGKERSDYRTAAVRLAKNQELVQIYRSYRAGLRAAKRYDFEDMILETIAALSRDEGMLRDLQETYHYILADEHQDVNASQNKILSLLTNFHTQPNLFVVGDEKQAIYRFQGASLDNFLYFETMVGKATVISLTENYRSGQSILDTAQLLIATDDPLLAPLRQPLTASAVPGAAVTLQSFSHQAVEDDWVAKDVERQLAVGVSAKEIAIIVRSNREVELFASALRKVGVAVAPTADGDILSHPLTNMVLDLIAALTEPTNQIVLTRLLHAPYWNLSMSDVWRVCMCTSRAVPLQAVMQDENQLIKAHVQNVTAVMRIPTVLTSVQNRCTTSRPVELVEYALTESGLLAHALTHDPYTGVRIIRRLYDEIEAMEVRGEVVTLVDVVTRLRQHQLHGITISAPFIITSDEAVVITTAHKAKGLEFDTVYVPHVTDKQWGGRNTKPTFDLPLSKHIVTDDVIDDERRLLYVALTRAKTTLKLSYAETNSDGKGVVPSRFLGDIETAPITRNSSAEVAAEFSVATALKPTPTDLPDTTFLRYVLRTKGLSPTALNNYLKSPWEYVYRNVLRVPQVKTPELQFGTCIHGVLEALQVQFAQGIEITPTIISKLLTKELDKTQLTDESYTRLHERGLSAVIGYLPNLSAATLAESRTEVSLTASLPTGIDDFPELLITGNLDRLDYHTGQVIQVVDYKTGKPKTRGQIEGTVKGGLGEYKRQLTFYALLLELQDDPSLSCRVGVLSFVEPDSRGKYREELFTITDEELVALKTELISVTKEIISGEALRRECDPDKCRYCDLLIR